MHMPATAAPDATDKQMNLLLLLYCVCSVTFTVHTCGGNMLNVGAVCVY